MTLWSWIASVTCLLGMWLNLRRLTAAYWLFAASAVMWIAYDARIGNWPRVALNAVALAMAAQGAWKYRGSRFQTPSRGGRK